MSEIPENSGFNIPSGYFESLPSKLSEKLADDQNWLSDSELAQNGFEVPEDYFDNLTQDILLKVESKETKVISLSKRYYYAAASIAAIFIIALVSNMDLKQDLTFDNIASTSIEDYFDNYEFDFSEIELAELVPMQEIGINDVLNTEINQEEIVDYLDDKIEDLHELNNIYNEE